VKISRLDLQYVVQPRIGVDENGLELFIGQLNIQVVNPIEQLDKLDQRLGIVHQEIDHRLGVQLPADIKYPGSTSWLAFM